MSSLTATQDDQLLSQLDAFNTQLPGFSPSLALVPGEVTSLKTLTETLRSALATQDLAEQAAQAATGRKDAARSSVETAFRAMKLRIKGSPAYRSAIGEQLGIVPASPLRRASLVQTQEQPKLMARLQADCSLEIRYRRRGHTGILLYCRRGNEPEFTLLSKQVGLNYHDERPNLTPGVPEMRSYQALYFDQDTPVGKMSDVLIVTVPVRS